MERYEQVEHTADIAARVFGRDMGELFENAAYAMFDMMFELEGVGAGESVEVEKEAPDNESLIISWLNEILYISYVKKTVFSEFHVKSLEGGKLLAQAKGQKLKESTGCQRIEIKAATYHDLEIKKTDSGYEITIVFDV